MKPKKTVLVHLDSARGYSRDILRGIYAYNNEFSHWNIVYEPAYFLKNSEDRGNVNVIQHICPDACIIEYSENLHDLINQGIPVVQVAAVHSHPDVPVVLGNYEQEGRMAATYFRRKGFKNVGFFGIRNLSWSEARLSSFSKNATDLDCSFFSYLLEGIDKDILSSNFIGLDEWLKNLPKPVGILCCNDNFGQILISSCVKAGLNVPHEVAVLGIDNDDLICNITYPNLSSIARNRNKIAFDICALLDNMMQGAKPSTQIIPAEPIEIIERASTDSLGYSDQIVAEANRFISGNLNRSITVNDVALHCRVTVKVLNSKFRSITGSSVHQEIQFRKLHRFKKLLESSLTVREIAFELGFEDSSHVSRWFSNLEGMNPMQWKKRYL